MEKEGSTIWHDEDPDAPMWRAVLLRREDQSGAKTQFTLILAFHHVIIDGIGSTALAQAILDELNAGADFALISPSPLPSKLGLAHMTNY